MTEIKKYSITRLKVAQFAPPLCHAADAQMLAALNWAKIHSQALHLALITYHQNHQQHHALAILKYSPAAYEQGLRFGHTTGLVTHSNIPQINGALFRIEQTSLRSRPPISPISASITTLNQAQHEGLDKIRPFIPSENVSDHLLWQLAQHQINSHHQKCSMIANHWRWTLDDKIAHSPNLI